MTDRLETFARLGDDLKKRALDAGDELMNRARPIARDLYGRGEAYGRDLYGRYRPVGEDLIRQARIRGADALKQAETYTRPSASMREGRSFMSSAAGQAAAAAALGVAAGLVLSVARKAAVQGVEATAGDWLAVTRAENRAIEKLFAAILDTTEKQTVRRAILLSRLSHTLNKAMMQKGAAIYPALKASLGDSTAMHLYEDHAKIRIFIHELQQIPKSDALWIERARAFQELMAHHIHEEEDDIFPKYHDAQTPEQNRRLTLMLHREGLRLA